MRISLIVPTYKEAAGIGGLIEELHKTFVAWPTHDWQVVVVDANSPDGTGDVVRSKMKVYPWLHLIIEQGKNGIGAAYITGIRYAIDTLHTDVFVHFDGDGQHDPKDLPRLAAEIENGYDYVLGSRYVKGGRVPTDWAWHRKFISRYGSLYTRLLLELPVKDATAGFKMIRVAGCGEFLSLSPEKLITPHYSYTIQLLYEALRHGAKIKEVPIVFRPREHDSSKMVLWDIVESLRVTTLLRLHTLKNWRLLRVVAIGAFGFILQTAFFETVGIQLGLLLPSTATVVGGEIAIISNFLLNERFSFRDKIARATGFIQRVWRFHLVAAGSIIIQWALVRGTEAMIGLEPVPLRVAYVVGVCLGFAVTYAGYYFWVWRQERISSKM